MTLHAAFAIKHAPRSVYLHAFITMKLGDCVNSRRLFPDESLRNIFATRAARTSSAESKRGEQRAGRQEFGIHL
jgi:hypothetical protein